MTRIVCVHLRSLQFNIGIKHDFLCINICWAPRQLLKPKPEWFQHLPIGPSRCKCIRKSYWSLLLDNSKTLEKRLRNILSYVPTMAWKGTVPGYNLKTPLPGQMITPVWRHKITFATVHVTDEGVRFCDGPVMLVCKTTKPCVNSTWIAFCAG